MTLEQRVQNLERSSRWWRRVSAVAVALLAAVLLVGGGDPVEELRVRKLIVVDQKGAAQITLETADGRASLTLGDLLRGQVSMAVKADGLTSLSLGSMRGEVSMEVKADGRPSVVLSHRLKTVSTWGILGDNTYFKLNDLNGKASAGLNVGLNGKNNIFTLRDDQGKLRVVASAGTELGGYLWLLHKKSKIGIELYVRDSGSAISVGDKAGNKRAVLGAVGTVNKVTGAKTTTAESTLTLFDAKSDVLWQAPR